VPRQVWFATGNAYYKKGKTKNAISQQLMGRFCSSFEELKPYPLAFEIVISKYTKLDINSVKVKNLFSWITPISIITDPLVGVGNILIIWCDMCLSNVWNYSSQVDLSYALSRLDYRLIWLEMPFSECSNLYFMIDKDTAKDSWERKCQSFRDWSQINITDLIGWLFEFWSLLVPFIEGKVFYRYLA